MLVDAVPGHKCGVSLSAWPLRRSYRRSTSGPRAGAENRARDEFPMFLAWRAVRAGVANGGKIAGAGTSGALV